MSAKKLLRWEMYTCSARMESASANMPERTETQKMCI